MAKGASAPVDLKKIIYVTYSVVLQFIGRLEGGIPKDPEMIKKWLELKGTSLADTYQEGVGAALDAAANSNLPTLEEVASKAWCGFLIDDQSHLCIEARQIGAGLKEAANVLRPILDITAFKARVAERAWISSMDPDTHELIRIKKNGDFITEPSGSYERPVHAMTRSGPITALKRTDYVDSPTIEFQLEVLDDGLLTEEMLEVLLDYMSRGGGGANRSQGAGRFKVIACKKKNEAEDKAAA